MFETIIDSVIATKDEKRATEDTTKSEPKKAPNKTVSENLANWWVDEGLKMQTLRIP